MVVAAAFLGGRCQEIKNKSATEARSTQRKEEFSFSVHLFSVSQCLCGIPMRRILIGGITLLSCSAVTAPSKRAGAGKSDPLVFVFLRVDPAQNLAILRPMIAPDIGVQLDAGPRTLKPGAVLRCEASVREHTAIIEGQVARVSDLVLNCLPAGGAGGGHKFVVKGLDFSPHR